RKITLLALAGSCGFLGASGLRNGVLASAALAWLEKKPSWESRPVNARPVKPAPVSQRNSRRVRRQNCPDSFIIASPGTISVEINKLIRVQHEETIILQRAFRKRGIASHFFF